MTSYHNNEVILNVPFIHFRKVAITKIKEGKTCKLYKLGSVCSLGAMNMMLSDCTYGVKKHSITAHPLLASLLVIEHKMHIIRHTLSVEPLNVDFLKSGYPIIILSQCNTNVDYFTH